MPTLLIQLTEMRIIIYYAYSSVHSKNRIVAKYNRKSSEQCFKRNQLKVYENNKQ